MTDTGTHIDLPLRAGWVLARLGEITQPIDKVNPQERPEVKFTYLDISSVDNQANKVVEHKIYYGRDAPSRARQLVRANDVLFSTVRTYLKNIAMVPDAHDGQIASTGFSVLRGHPGVSSKYLFYYCLTDEFIDHLNRLQRGTSYPAVRDGDVRAQSIPLAPSSEQRRIVEAIETQFTRLAAAVAALQRARANLQRYKASVLKAACEGRLVPTEAELARREGRDYEPAGVLLQRILAERRARWEEQHWAKEVERAKKKAAQAKRRAAGLPARTRDIPEGEWQDLSEEACAQYLPKNDQWKRKYREPKSPDTSELPELSKGWVRAKVDQVFDLSSGIAFKKAEYVEDGVRLLQIANVTFGKIIWDSKAYLPPDYLDRYPNLALEAGDVLMALNRPILGGRLKIGELGAGDVPAILYQRVGRLDLYDVSVKRYLFWYAQSPSFVGQLEKLLQGVDQPFITKTKLMEMLVPLPPLTEKKRIIEEVERRLSVIDALEGTLDANLARAERLRQAILKRAFEGRLVPQDPSDEPASDLLEKITTKRKTSRESAERGSRTKKGKKPRQLRMF